MTSEAALKVLELQDWEKRRKDMVKETKGRKEEEREHAKQCDEESGVKDRKNQKSKKK